MPKKIMIKLITSILLLSFATACGTGNENDVDPPDDPQVEPLENQVPLNLEEYEPTRNEMNEDFGKEIKGDAEDFPDDYLEKDEETPSSP